MKYYNKATKTEILFYHPDKNHNWRDVYPKFPIHLVFDVDNSDHVMLDSDNPFFHELPEGMELSYDDDDIPNGYQNIPITVLTAEQQATQDLSLAGVTSTSLLIARHAYDRGSSTALSAIDASIDAIVVSSGLPLATVIGLII